MTLRTKLLTFFVVLGVAPILALGVSNYVLSMRAVEGLIASRTGSIAHRAATEISNLYALRQSDLLLLAENAETQALYRAHLDGGSAARETALSAADQYLRRAWEILGSSYRWIEFRDTAGAVLYELGESPTARAQEMGLGQSNVPNFVRITQPIGDVDTSRELGTLVTAVRVDVLLPSNNLSASFGSEGYCVVLDRSSGRVIYHRRRAFVQQPASALLGPEGWDIDPEIFSNESGSFVYQEEEARRVASFASLATPPWTVVSSASVDEFAAPFARTRSINLLLVALVTVTVAVAFFLMTGRATRSLEELTVAADEVAAGNFEPRVPPPGADEVGRLSAAFAMMVQEVGEMLRRIERSRQMAVIGEFASQISHEIRNPLTSIKLNLQSLERDIESQRIPEDCARAVDICLREVRRLDRVVRGVLSVARTRSPTRELCSVHSSVREALEVLRPQLEDQEIVIEEDLRAREDTVRGDQEQLKGVFLNILLNGAQAMPKGGTLRVSTDVGDEARGHETREIRVRVADEGPGVPPESKEKIFEPFFSTKEEGTGFGLALALQVVEEHGGALRLEDDGGAKGAVFVVDLPLARTSQRVAAAEQTS